MEMRTKASVMRAHREASLSIARSSSYVLGASAGRSRM